MKRLLSYFDRHPEAAVILALTALGFCMLLSVYAKEYTGAVSIYGR